MQVKLSDGTVLNFPEGMSEDEIKRVVREKFKPPIGGVEPGPYYGGRLAMQAAKNIPGSVAGIAKDIYGAVTNPVETAKAIGGLAQGTGNLLGRKAAELVQGQPMEPMEEYSEAAPRAVGQALKDRYGSGEAILRTAVEDPAGMALDVSGAGMAIKPLRAAARAAEPLGAIGRTATAPIGQLPEKIYRSAAGIPKSQLDKGLDLAKRGLEAGIPVSEGGLRKIADIRASVGAQIGDLIAESAANMILIPKTVVTKHFDDMMRGFEGTPHGNRNIAKVKQMKQEFLSEFGNKQMIDAEELQKYKVSAYDQAYKRSAINPVKASNAKTTALRESARGAKEAIEARVPEIVPLNKQFGTAAELQPFIERAVDRIQRMDPGFSQMFAKTLNNPAAKAKIAKGLQRLRDGDMGWLEKNLNSAEIRTALALSGRLEEEIGTQ